jgi:hypothetical protein
MMQERAKSKLVNGNRGNEINIFFRRPFGVQLQGLVRELKRDGVFSKLPDVGRLWNFAY